MARGFPAAARGGRGAKPRGRVSMDDSYSLQPRAHPLFSKSGEHLQRPLQSWFHGPVPHLGTGINHVARGSPRVTVILEPLIPTQKHYIPSPTYRLLSARRGETQNTARRNNYAEKWGPEHPRESIPGKFRPDMGLRDKPAC